MAATYTWSIPSGKAITGSTYIKDTDNNISDTIDDLVEFVNSTGVHAGQGLTFDFVDKASVQTISGAKTFSAVLVASDGVTGSLTGNADTSTVLATPRAITLAGDTTGTVNFDGSSDVTITSSFRAGMIMLWSGSTASIPSGWFLCDGLNGTPNLLNRAIIGAGDEFAVGASGDGTIPSHVHSANHDHTASSDNDTHTHGIPLGEGGGWTNPTGTVAQRSLYGTTLYTDTSGGDTHNHIITVNTKTMDTGANGTGSVVVPKHYALAYIMKG